MHIYSDASPRSPARIGHDVEKEVQDAIATYTTTQYILIHASHTYTSTSQSRDHVIMSELGITILHGAHVHRRSTIDFAPIILADLLVKGFHPAAASPNSPRSILSSSFPPESGFLSFVWSFVLFLLFPHSRAITSRVLVYASYLLTLSLSLSQTLSFVLSPTFYRFGNISCMQRRSLLRMMCITYHNGNS